MKICFLAAASSIHTVRWVNALVNKGHEVILITMHPEKENKVNDEVKVIEFKIKNSLGYYLNIIQLKYILKNEKPDILNVHYASGYGTLSRLVNFKPTLLSVWGSDVYLYPYINKGNYNNIQKNLHAATMIASTSYEMKKQTQTLMNNDGEIKVTPFGIDLNLFKPIQKKQNNETLKIGIVKTLEEIYGVKYLIEAFHLLLMDQLNINIILEIVGDGSQKEFLKQLVKNMNIEEYVIFTDKIPNNQVPHKLNSFDIYCAPSLSESFGVAVIEASACKLPVVVTNVGGLKEVVQHERTGLIVEPESPEQLATALKTLILNPNLRLEYGEMGRKLVEERYNWSENVIEMEKNYKLCIEKVN